MLALVALTAALASAGGGDVVALDARFESGEPAVRAAAIDDALAAPDCVQARALLERVAHSGYLVSERDLEGKHRQSATRELLKRTLTPCVVQVLAGLASPNDSSLWRDAALAVYEAAPAREARAELLHEVIRAHPASGPAVVAAFSEDLPAATHDAVLDDAVAAVRAGADIARLAPLVPIHAAMRERALQDLANDPARFRLLVEGCASAERFARVLAESFTVDTSVEGCARVVESDDARVRVWSVLRKAPGLWPATPAAQRLPTADRIGMRQRTIAVVQWLDDKERVRAVVVRDPSSSLDMRVKVLSSIGKGRYIVTGDFASDAASFVQTVAVSDKGLAPVAALTFRGATTSGIAIVETCPAEFPECKGRHTRHAFCDIRLDAAGALAFRRNTERAGARCEEEPVGTCARGTCTLAIAKHAQTQATNKLAPLIVRSREALW